jgi:hypothetical protein
MQLNKDYASYLVSEGSLFVDDLLYACLQFLQTEPMDPALTEVILSMEQKLANTVLGANASHAGRKESILLDEVFPLLEEIAPQGHFFGIHPGDPGRIGFWEDCLHFNKRNKSKQN